MNNIKLENIINKYLNSNKIKDNAINGLQIEGEKKIKNIITSVSINIKLINKTIKNKANTIIVHHGILWHNDNHKIYGIKRKIIKKILLNNINLYAWHLPIDIHPKIGNNISIARKINIKKIISHSKKKFPVLICKTNNDKIYKKILKLSQNIHYIKSKNKKIHIIGICSGSGQKFLEKAILLYNIDTYISGEISENIFYIIKSYNINFFALGHYKSEINGINNLGKFIKKKNYIKTKFIKINNPY